MKIIQLKFDRRRIYSLINRINEEKAFSAGEISISHEISSKNGKIVFPHDPIYLSHETQLLWH